MSVLDRLILRLEKEGKSLDTSSAVNLNAEQALRSIMHGIANVTGETFFAKLVSHLAQTLNVRYAFLGKLEDGPPKKIRTLAFVVDGKTAPNFTFDLSGTPSEQVVGKSLFYFPSGVKQKFSMDLSIQKHNVESYIGVPLFGSDKKPLGLLSILHDDLMPNPSLTQDLVQVFAARAGTELERQQTGQALTDALELTKELICSMPDGLIVLDEAGKYVDVNPAFCKMTGFSKEELVGKEKPFPYWPEEEYENIERTFDKTISGEAGDSELIFKRKSGERFPALVSPSKVRDADGRVVRHIATVKDITELKSTEKELSESLKRFQTLSDSSFEGIAITENAIILDVNERICEMLGYAYEDMIGENVMKMVAPESRDYVMETIRAGVERTYEHLCVRSDNTLLPVEVHGKTMPYKGRVVRVTAIRDLTERKRAEETLNRRDAILQAVSYAAEGFLRFTSWRSNVQKILQRLGEATGVSRAYIFEVQKRTNDGIIISQTYEWVNEGIEPQIDNQDMQNFKCADIGMQRFEKHFVKGEILYGNISEFPKSEQEFLTQQSIKSIVNVPIMINNVWWGLIGFDECVAERKWTQTEVDALKAAADTFGAAIANAESFEKIEQLKEQLELENEYLRDEARQVMEPGDIVGHSPALMNILQQIELVAPSDSTVLILGESGTGKELIARAIHEKSGRNQHPLIKVNCASIPLELFESEFFGHVRGAFTGAIKDRVGRFKMADGGTLFLDEVGEIPMSLQGKLLRVLQEGEFERVGEDVTQKVNVRIIAATNADLKTAIKKNQFRGDLFYRLSVFPITVPPLRERVEDIPAVAQHFLENICQRLNRPHNKFKKKHIIQLQEYSWPGNVRELENVIERAVIVSPTEELNLNLPKEMNFDSQLELKPSVQESITSDIYTDEEMKELERKNLIKALGRTNWKISGKGGASELLSVHPNTITSRIKSLGIEKPAQSK